MCILKPLFTELLGNTTYSWDIKTHEAYRHEYREIQGYKYFATPKIQNPYTGFWVGDYEAFELACNGDLRQYIEDKWCNDEGEDIFDFSQQDNITDIEGLSIVDETFLDNQEFSNPMIPVTNENNCYNGFLGYGINSHMRNYFK